MGRREFTVRASLSLLCMLLASGCDAGVPGATPLLGPEGASLQQSEPRPFLFTLSGHANPDFSQGPCNVVNTESGTGVASHLGSVSWDSEELVNFCVDPDNPSRAAVTGKLMIMAASGDRLTASYTAVVDADFAAGRLTANGEYLVTGGTGRFTDASGNGTLAITGSLVAPFAVEGSFAGDIVY